MKKALALILALILVMSMAACGAEKAPEKNDAPVTDTDTNTNTSSGSSDEGNNTGNNGVTVDENASPANKLLAVFKNELKNTSSPAELADILVMQDFLGFMGGSMPVEEGYLNGFSDEIKGFSEGAMFAPMIGAIPFIGYVFTVDGNADAFVSELKEKADLRWNVCTEADEMVAYAEGNTVFFCMSPLSLEDDGETIAETEYIEEAGANEDVSPANRLYSSFVAESLFTSEPSEIAVALTEKDFLPTAFASMDVSEGFLNGFSDEIKGFSKGAMFGPMIGAIPCIGYVFSVDGDVQEFIDQLKEKADLRWNICTAADEMVVESEGNLVFFCMAPLSFDE